MTDPLRFERQYLELMRDLLEHGDPRADRTGIGTRATFGTSLSFDLSAGHVPLITTKRVAWKTAIKEMLWMLTGSTSIKPLLEQNVRIWTDWPLDVYRKATGEEITQTDFEHRILAEPEFAARWGELGPVYGKQWRRWNGADGREHDQIAALITTLKTNPGSRRMLFHAWNVAEIGEMALPPCHMVYQYDVTSDGRLDCLMLQRSVDLLLGAPFNYMNTAVLQMMLAQQAGLTPGRMTWVGGNVHLYDNHREQARLQIAREPRPSPVLRILRKPDSIDGYRIEDFALEGYEPHAAISADVAV